MVTEKEESEDTMIPIKRITTKRLKKLGTMEDTYDSLINKLIDNHEKGSIRNGGVGNDI